MFRTSFNELTTLTLSNGEIAMLGGFTTFIVPLDSGGNKYSRLLEWRDTRDLQWGILIMFGGGLALAKAFSDAGIIQYIGDFMTENDFSHFTLVSFLVLTMTLMTTLMSNVSLVAVFAPILPGDISGGQCEFY